MADPDTLHTFIDRFAGNGDKTAILALKKEGARKWSYARLAETVSRLARGLLDRGFEKGERAAILADPSPEWVAAALGVIRAGGVAVLLDAQLDDRNLERILEDSGTQRVFTQAEQCEHVEKLGPEGKLEVLALDEEETNRSWRRLLSDSDGQLPQADPDDLATMFYTSGTTGPPKGVPLSHANLVFQLNTLKAADFLHKSDRFLLPLPMHHVYPFVIGTLVPLSLDLVLIIPHALTGPQVIRAIKEGRATCVVGVPRLYRALYTGVQSRLDSLDGPVGAAVRGLVRLSHWLRRRLGLRWGKALLKPLHRQFGEQLRLLASGGSALDLELAWNLEGLGWTVTIGYGLTETAPLLTLNPPGTAELGSVGPAVAGVDLRLEPTGKPQELDGDAGGGNGLTQGEVVARGPNVFKGYWNLPDKTGEAFTKDGWFRTGDLGYFKGKYLFLLGRASTLIVTESGKNIQPDEVEEVYAASPVIAEMGVLQDGGKLVGVIVPDPEAVEGAGKEKLEEAVRSAVQERSHKLPSYKQIVTYRIVRDPLPRTRLGKIRRHKLEELYKELRKDGRKPPSGETGLLPESEMSDQDRALLENSAARKVWEWLGKRYPEERITPDTSPQLDLEVDSLEWLNITMEVRARAGVELGEEALGRINTVRDLLEEVAHPREDGEGVPLRPFEEPDEVLGKEHRKWLAPLGPVETVLSALLYAANWLLSRIYFRLEARGLDKLPQDKNYIFTPNHASYLDAFCVAAAFEYSRLRNSNWAGWTGIAFANPFNRFISRLGQVVPIDRDRALVSSLALGAAVLKRKRNLIWFPEGERTRDGNLLPFKPGIGMLIDHFSVPVVPVYIHGTFDAMPIGVFWPRPVKVVVEFGEPLDSRTLKEEGSGKQDHERIADALRHHVEELSRHQV